MPSIYRVNTDHKAIIVALDPDAAFAEDEPSDIDSDEETEEPNHEPNDNKSRFLWPQHPSQVARALSNSNVTPQDAFITADLELQAVHYHPRRLILDLKSSVLELEPLLHSAPQIFTLAQWEGVSRVPREERGYKIAFAIEMTTHILALLSHDNLWHLFWRSSTEFTRLQKQCVPDSVLGFHAWCKFHVEYFTKNPPKRRTQLTIYQWLIKPGPHPFQGSGRYCTAEVLALAGIPPWTSAFDVMTRPELYSVLIEADAQFHSERSSNRMLEGNTSDDFSLGASVQDQIEYSTHLRVHGKKEWHGLQCTPLPFNMLQPLLTKSEDIAIRTRVEAQDTTNRSNIFVPKADIASATHPFDLSNIAPSLLCFGHLGELIVGEQRWAALLKNEIPDNLMTLARYFRDYQNKVLRNLTGAKRPPTMTPKLPFRIDRESLSLLPEPQRPCRLPTNLLRIKNQKRGKIWTVLEAPWMEQRVFKGLCFWHQDMSDEQKLLMQKNWTSRSQYPEGMRKLDQASLGAEKKWKSSRGKTIRDTVPDISKRNLGIELRKRRTNERQQLTEQGIDLAAAALESAERFQSGSKKRGKLKYPVLNKEPCGTLNDDGCLQIFPYFDGPSGSLCMKCKKLQNAETEEQRTRIREDQSLQSCEGCGLCSSQLTEPFCGRCKRRDREAKGLPDPHADAAAARLNVLHRRMGNPNPPSGTARTLQPITNNPVIGPTTSAAELEAIRTAKSGGHFTVHVFYTTKGVVNKNIGNHSFNLPMDMHMDEVLARAVAHGDLEWTTDSAHPLSLKVEDCNLRFKGNMSIEPDTLSGTLRGLYNFYISRPDKIHVTANNRLGLAKGTYLAFECSINVQRNLLWLMSVEYDRRVVELKARYAEDDDDSGSLLSNKRRSNDSSSGEPTKRRRGTGTLSSNVRFANNLGALGYGAPPLAPAKCVEVTFKHFAATVTEEQADMSEISAEQEGRIEVNPLILSISDRGKSKNVYKFYIKDKMFAAKRFFDTGNRPNADGTVVVSKRDNDVGLAHDLYRLARMQMFRSKYMERAATVNFGEISNFEVSSGFLITIQSALPMLDTGALSPDAALVDNSTYLVEPFRSSSVVRKFSGTLGVTADYDKLAMTIMSFSHFVMEYTACTMAIADLQGSLHAEPGEARTMYLFDPMTHTLTQDSGVGDFGCAGIQDAIENHDCNIFCKGLNLSPKTVLEETFARQKADHGNAVAVAAT
ncbi:hypothetical protein C8F04DRAFT_1180443 [Mycena alexandri]|uniref:Alpha-type protein kinase domain-containing protein n=1 Tax=Mycena alexandri TaxID=1745969 RepID=A0AAD6T0X8_9AGAR|nr:hypothetical protein C8F04DRAFT_1180443 [Mycena alexandri]